MQIDIYKIRTDDAVVLGQFPITKKAVNWSGNWDVL